MIVQIKDKIIDFLSRRLIRLWRKKDFIVGLDIGTSSIKIAQFTKKEDGLHLIKADLKEIKQTDDEALREKEVISTLRDLFRGVDVKKSKIIVSINCPKTAIKIAKAPYMPKAELRDGISLEAKNYFPFPIDDSLLDYEILGDVVEKGIRKYEVAVSVSPKATVEKYLSLLGKAGIKPASFVPSSYALQKVAQELSTEEGKTQCFVDMGKLHTELIIRKGKYLLFFRKIPVTGDDFTKVMTGALVSDRGRTELTIDEAEKIKQETGIPSEAESKIIDDKISATQILSMLRTPLEQLVSEIERCFDYYREESGGGKIDSLVLFGGGVSLSGLIKVLSEGLGIEVKLGDSLILSPEGRGKGEGDKISYRLEMAIGAALTEAKGINLLPPEIKEKTKKVIKRGVIEAVFTALVIIPALLSIGMNIKIDNFNKRIAAAKMEMASLSEQIKDVEAKMFAQVVLSHEPYWEDVFHEIGSLIPDEIRVENVRVENKVINIKGIADSPDGQQILANFIVSLEKGLFNGMKLIESKNLSDRPGIEFEISCWIDYER